MAIYLITPLIERPEALRAALERLLPAADRYALPAQRGNLRDVGVVTPVNQSPQ